MPRLAVRRTKVFTFDELSETAKNRAHSDWLNLGDYWGRPEEWFESAKAFCEIAPVTITRADYDRAHVDATFNEPNDDWRGEGMLGDLSGVRAWKWLENNGWFDLAKENAAGGCTLTGFCGDCPLFDAIHKLAKTPDLVPDLESLFLECLQDWIFAARSDLEESRTEEVFEGMCEANEWEFTSSGRFYA